MVLLLLFLSVFLVQVSSTSTLRPTLMATKNLHENGPNPFFFFFFQSYGNEDGPDSYREIRLSVS